MNARIVKKRKRKQRIVNNAVVDVNNVSVDPGLNYTNWITITREKLKKRELTLFSVKKIRIESVVNKELTECKEKYIIPEDIIDSTMQTLYDIIDRWSGVNMSRRKKPTERYRDYFCIGKNWFDQTKKKIFGTLFWAVIFKHIHNFLQRNSQLNLEIIIIKGLFEGTVKYSNTKPLPIINGGSVMCSNDMHEYLYNLHNSLQIKQWIKQQEDSGNYRNISLIIVQHIRAQLNSIINSNNNNNNNTNNNNNNNNNVTNNRNSENNNNTNSNTNNNTNANTNNSDNSGSNNSNNSNNSSNSNNNNNNNNNNNTLNVFNPMNNVSMLNMTNINNNPFNVNIINHINNRNNQMNNNQMDFNIFNGQYGGFRGGTNGTQQQSANFRFSPLATQFSIPNQMLIDNQINNQINNGNNIQNIQQIHGLQPNANNFNIFSNQMNPQMNNQINNQMNNLTNSNNNNNTNNTQPVIIIFAPLQTM